MNIHRAHTTLPTKKYAWVVLLMIGDSYVPGALIVAHSLRLMKTKHDIICMVTEDIPSELRLLLRGTINNPIYDSIVEVQYITQKSRKFSSEKQHNLYAHWIDQSFTKWNCLTLTQYDRVILVDADMLFVTNCDDLFDLQPPAACYSNPWAFPYQDGGLNNPYFSPDLVHGAPVSAQQIYRALHSESFVGWGALVLLEPSIIDYNAFIDMIRTKKIFGEEYELVSGVDEISIALFYIRKNPPQPWTHIHQQYIAIPWKPDWVSDNIRAYHYHGRKPWYMFPDEYKDITDWWKIVENFLIIYPDYHAIFTYKDADLAQVKITEDLHYILTKNATHIINKWLMNIVAECNDNTSIYHRAMYASSSNAIFLDDLNKLIDNQCGHIFKKIISYVTMYAPMRNAGHWSCNAHYKLMDTPRTQQLIALGGRNNTIKVVIRYSIFGDYNPCIRQSYADYLYSECGVRNEAFASPIDSRFFGKKDAKYFSLFPDTDSVFGSSGNFLTSANYNYPGNWFVHPPPAEIVVARAARVVINILLRTKCTIFFLAPENKKANEILRLSPFYKSEIRFDATTPNVHETIDGKPLLLDVPFIYTILMST